MDNFSCAISITNEKELKYVSLLQTKLSSWFNFGELKNNYYKDYKVIEINIKTIIKKKTFRTILFEIDCNRQAAQLPPYPLLQPEDKLSQGAY